MSNGTKYKFCNLGAIAMTTTDYDRSNPIQMRVSDFIRKLSSVVDAMCASYLDEVGEPGFILKDSSEDRLLTIYRIIPPSSVNDCDFTNNDSLVDAKLLKDKCEQWRSLVDIPASQAEIVVGISKFWIQKRSDI
ncbi:hypothetical protein [Aulosira sp. FACHB-615]|uniref:hypothetical protein n=1 Tax=Aulosira sp. FACHB-615 TaxID=2692777 RepID=UPI001684C874|nr:hypothetical protein [Aulosira sp. FACHB-615]MBD2492486.1 hypothetical protein [Aulosira sp. FACHB-615]